MPRQSDLNIITSTEKDLHKSGLCPLCQSTLGYYHYLILKSTIAYFFSGRRTFIPHEKIEIVETDIYCTNCHQQIAILDKGTQKQHA